MFKLIILLICIVLVQSSSIKIKSLKNSYNLNDELEGKKSTSSSSSFYDSVTSLVEETNKIHQRQMDKLHKLALDKQKEQKDIENQVHDIEEKQHIFAQLKECLSLPNNKNNDIPQSLLSVESTVSSKCPTCNVCEEKKVEEPHCSCEDKLKEIRSEKDVHNTDENNAINYPQDQDGPIYKISHKTGRICKEGDIELLRVMSVNAYINDKPQNRVDRVKALFDVVAESNADVVAFQDVQDWFLLALSKTRFIKDYYVTDFNSGHAPGGLVLISKYPITKTQFFETTQPGQVEIDQRGRLLVAKVSLPNDLAIDFATTTLNWRDGNERVDNLDFIASIMSASEDAVILGNFNFGSKSLPESDNIPKDWIDVWTATQGDKHGPTWDPSRNIYARNFDAHSQPSRIDRVFVKSINYAPSSIATISGKNGHYPTSHYSLFAYLRAECEDANQA